MAKPADKTWELDALSRAIDIHQPEAVTTHEIAGIGTRFLAGLIDFVIKIPVEAGVVLFLHENVPAMAHVWRLTPVLLLLAAANITYSFVFELLADGQTPGKNACGLRVVGVNGERPTLLRS